MVFSNTRLRREKDIQRVLRKGKNVFQELCGLRYIPNELKITRAAIVIGVKVDKRAVVRNRLRRQYREILRLLEPQLKPGYDFLLFPTKKAIEASYADKHAALYEILRQHQLLTKEGDASSHSRVSKDTLA